jgi:EAL domain-containing protein (putative c-di-GMP-specific phosphodiesterase class I)
VLRESCRQFVAWRGVLGEACPRYISVNLSRSQLACHDLPATIEQILRDTGMSPGWLQLEITENQAVRATGTYREALARLRALGVRLAQHNHALRKVPLDHIVHYVGGRRAWAVTEN